jgi:hypothetical protein
MDVRLLLVVVAVLGLMLTIATQWRQLVGRERAGGALNPQLLGIGLVMGGIVLLMLVAVLASLGMLPGFEPMP